MDAELVWEEEAAAELSGGGRPRDGRLVPLARRRRRSRLALGRALPNVPWTIRQRDRIYNVLLAGGQGSGKSSMLLRFA